MGLDHQALPQRKQTARRRSEVAEGKRTRLIVFLETQLALRSVILSVDRVVARYIRAQVERRSWGVKKDILFLMVDVGRYYFGLGHRSGYWQAIHHVPHRKSIERRLHLPRAESR